MKLIPMKPDDWPSIQAIYLAGIASGHATFETAGPTWEQWDATHHTFGRLALWDDEQIRGWAALSRTSTRQAYAGVAEVSVYVAPESRGHGFGRALLDALIVESERNGLWMLQASIFPENVASVTLHRRSGFREVGQRERIGKLNGVWRNTILMERRSALVGVE